MISLVDRIKRLYFQHQQQIKEKCLENGQVFPVSLYATDIEKYEKNKGNLGLLPIISSTEFDTKRTMESNFYELSTRVVGNIVVYYHNGIFREWITDTPILGLCESFEADFFTNRLFYFNIPYGKTEPIFFKFAKWKNLLEYGCVDRADKVLKPVSDEYLTAYESMHKDKGQYKTELAKLKSKAMSDYCDVLLLYLQFKRQEENKCLIRRRQIQKINCVRESN